MADKLVTLKLGRIFSQYERRLRAKQNEMVVEGGKILRREQETSMRSRWFRSGASVGALGQGEVVKEGVRAIYRLTTGKFYDIFGEYGTGRRGAATGQPTPKGYRHGSKPGMSARRFSRLAIDAARPQIVDVHVVGLRELAKNF